MMPLTFFSKKLLSYLPIDIRGYEFNLNKIGDLFDRSSHVHHHGIWDCVPLIGQVQEDGDFLSEEKFEKAWKLRYSENINVSKNPYLTSYTAGIFDLMTQLPFKQITHAQILRQKVDIKPHFDFAFVNGKFIDDSNVSSKKIEPILYKILLNKTFQTSFFMTRSPYSKLVYTTMPDDTNVFCVREGDVMHGSTHSIQNKYVVSIFGHLDVEKHLYLQKRSLLKYKKYAIYL